MRKLAESFENSSVYTLVLIIVVLLSLCYWVYLYFTTKMMVVFDSVGYENAGRLIFEKGWREYFVTGPEREPVYIFLIALSMKLGQIFGLHYQHFQKLF